MKKMLFNPIIKKDLQMSSRSLKFPIALMCYAIGLTLVALVMLMFLTNGFSILGYNTGVSYEAFPPCFMALVFIQLALICIIMPILTAGTIAGERERQTLDIMLTTPIRPISIVVGKLGTALYKVFLFAVASLPALSICFIYGGISWVNLLVFLVQLLALAFFIGAIGVWCSCLFRKTIVAVIMTLVFEYVFMAGPPMIVGTIATICGIIDEVFANGYFANGIHMGPTMFVMILDPYTTAIDAVVASNTGYHMATEIIADGLSGIFAKMEWLTWFTDLWSLFGTIVTVGLGMFFVWAAAHCIDSIRRKGVKNVKRKR